MGGGAWTSAALDDYTYSTRGVSSTTYASNSTVRVQDAFKAYGIHRDLNPRYFSFRECLDTDEHPNTTPVILALDVTGSMGSAAVEVSKKLGYIMTELYTANTKPDIEFCIMGIGDLDCDDAPVQMSQFESDIRIAEHLDKVYFEGHGGGNFSESYTAAWYMGLYHCKLDCWKRGKKGIIITLGDELLNPYLGKDDIAKHIGDKVQDDIDTADLYKQAIERFDIHHISVDDPGTCYARYNSCGNCRMVDNSWKLLGENYHVSTIDGLHKLIAQIINGPDIYTPTVSTVTASPNEISW